MILRPECEDEPCDQNAECFNTNEYYHYTCVMKISLEMELLVFQVTNANQ